MKLLRKITLLTLIVICFSIGLFVVNLDEWRASWQLATAQSALRERDADRAMRALVEAARLNPSDGEVYVSMARAFRRRGELKDVRQSLEKASRLGIPQDRIRREEWLAMAQAGQMTEAAPHLPQLLVNPGEDGPDICEAYVNGYFLTYQLGEAYRILDAWEKDYPQDPQPHVFRAAMSNKTAAWNSAAEHLRKAHKLAPRRNDIRLELANALLVVQETDEAAALFEQLLKSQPDHPEVLAAWGQVLLERSQIDQARSTLERLLQSHPRNVAALRTLGQLHLSVGRFTEAIHHLEQAVAIKGHDTEVRYALAAALQKIGRSAEARRHYEFVARSQEANQRLAQLISNVRTKNADVASRFEIAQLLLEYGEPRDRLHWLHSVVMLDPTHKAAHAELAKCYEHLGDLEESRKHARLADAGHSN